MKKVEEAGEEEEDEKETAVLFLRRNNSTFDKQSGTKNTALFLRGNNSTFDTSLSEALIPARGIKWNVGSVGGSISRTRAPAAPPIL